MRRFAAIYDAHVGFESVGGHKKPFHDPKAINAVLSFLSDFKPQDFILGGDILDCGAISHHNYGKPRKTEGFRLQRDSEVCRELLINPLEEILPKDGEKVYLTGNHEDWIEDLLDKDPALEGIISVDSLLKLDKWKRLPQGIGYMYARRLYFLHGDTIPSGETCAKTGVINYEKCVRFGHFHTYQTYTKTSPIETKQPRTGIAIPCLCVKDVGYNQKKPNKWCQGVYWGYMDTDGSFADVVSVVVDGKMIANGKIYKG